VWQNVPDTKAQIPLHALHQNFPYTKVHDLYWSHLGLVSKQTNTKEVLQTQTNATCYDVSLMVSWQVWDKFIVCVVESSKTLQIWQMDFCGMLQVLTNHNGILCDVIWTMSLIITGRPACTQCSMLVLDLLSGPEMGFSLRKWPSGDTLPQ